MKTVTAEETADCLLKFVTIYGIPEAVLMDQGRNFEAKTLAKVGNYWMWTRRGPQRTTRNGMGSRSELTGRKVRVSRLCEYWP
jgi:hypothetical protein